RTKVRGQRSRAAFLAMAFNLIESTRTLWRAVNAPNLVALVRAGAAFVNGHLVERSGITDWHRDGTLAEYAAVEARNLAPLPGNVDFTVGASLPISGLTAWQGLVQHGRLRAGQSVLAHGAAGAVGSVVTQLAREFGAYVIGTGQAVDRQAALDFGANEFLDLDHEDLDDIGGVDLVFDVIGGDIQRRSASIIRPGGTLVSV